MPKKCLKKIHVNQRVLCGISDFVLLDSTIPKCLLCIVYWLYMNSIPATLQEYRTWRTPKISSKLEVWLRLQGQVELAKISRKWQDLIVANDLGVNLWSLASFPIFEILVFKFFFFFQIKLKSDLWRNKCTQKRKNFQNF